MAMKMNERGMEMEIQTNSTETWVGINFCGGVHGNAFVCIALTGPQRSKTIKLRETLSVFLLSSTKNCQKSMTKPCIHICMEFAFSSLWAAKVLQSVCRYIFKLKYVQALPSLFEHRVTFRKRRKKRIETEIFMVNHHHLEPATRTSMYKAWN